MSEKLDNIIQTIQKNYNVDRFTCYAALLECLQNGIDPSYDNAVVNLPF